MTRIKLLLLLLHGASFKTKGSQNELHPGISNFAAEHADVLGLFSFFGIPTGDLAAFLLRAIGGKTETFS